MRKKEDMYNWGLGAITAGCVCGTWQRSRPIGVFASIIFAAFAMAKKEMELQGYHLFQVDNVKPQSLSIWLPDLTLTKEQPRNWVPGPPKDQ